MTNTTEPKTITTKFRVFLTVWFGQSISLIGTELTSFALGVWVYLQTGSTTQYTLIAFSASLPGILLSPIGGIIIDRVDRRWVMLISDTASALKTSLILYLLLTNQLEIWHIYVIIGFGSLFDAVQWPAYMATVTLLVPQKQLGRANGMIQLGFGFGRILAPPLAGALLDGIGLQGVIAIDLTTFAFAAFTLLLVRFPRPKPVEGETAPKKNWWQEISYGWTYIKSRPGLRFLLFIGTALNLNWSMVTILFTPLVLNFASPTTLGFVLSVSGLGLLAGGAIMSVWGGLKRHIHSVFFFAFLSGLVLFLGGLQPNVLLVSVAAFLFLFNFPIITSANQAIWQTAVPPERQGRVFSFKQMISTSSIPISYLLAGPLTDRIFEPLLAADGLLANSVGQVIGTGPDAALASCS